MLLFRISDVAIILGIFWMRAVYCIPIETMAQSTHPNLSAPLVEDDLEGDVGESVEEFKNFFVKYNQMVPSKPDPAHSSASGNVDNHNTDKTDITQTPSFMERVVELQKDFGIIPTGIISQSLTKKIHQDRCGMTDPPRDENAPANYQVRSMWESKYIERLNKYHLTYSFIKKDFPSKLNHDDIVEGVLSAMCMWEWNSNVRFIKNVGDNENEKADITVGFGRLDHGDNFAFDGKGGTLAHAFYPENGRLHFDEDESWYLSKKDEEEYGKRDLFTVAAHEIGHNLGLQHSKQDALMAPFYNFRNSFASFELPADDKNGMTSMYGSHNPTDPSRENSACRSLFEQFKVKKGEQSSRPIPTITSTTTTKQNIKTRPTRRPITTTRRLITTTKETHTETACQDDTTLGIYCQRWKDRGYCTSVDQAESMQRRCKVTCNFCAVKPEEGTTGKKDSVCNLQGYDAVATVYDGGNYFDGYFIKDDYYIRPVLKLEIDRKSKLSLLDSHNTLSRILTYFTDPKLTKPGAYKLSSLFTDAKNVIALLPTRQWYLVFRSDGTVQQYSRGTPSIVKVDEMKIDQMFKKYPHNTIDAAYMEYVDYNIVYTLFYKSSIWQFKESGTSRILDTRDSYNKLQYIPIKGRSGVNITSWHGVGACQVDAVFKYKDVPYFLKGNLFWPAVASEPAIARDVTYHFFRCGDGSQQKYDIPKGCRRVSGRSYSDLGGGAANHTARASLLYLVSFVISVLLMSVK